MAIWTVQAISSEPTTSLARWRVMELPDGDRHLVGYAVEAREGRTSSPIRRFDVGCMRAVTNSGHVYQLVGRPGADSDADYVWATWQRVNEVTEFADVSMQVWNLHLAIADSPIDDPGPQP